MLCLSSTYFQGVWKQVLNIEQLISLKLSHEIFPDFYYLNLQAAVLLR